MGVIGIILLILAVIAWLGPRNYSNSWIRIQRQRGGDLDIAIMVTAGLGLIFVAFQVLMICLR